MAGTSQRAHRRGRTDVYFALTVAVLVVAVYLTFQLLGFVPKLLFLTVAALLALAAVRAWRAQP